MRNGNDLLLLQPEQTFHIVRSVPMRNGNENQSTTVLNTFTVRSVPMRNGNIVAAGIFAIGDI
ncbi:conserved protein of unknown function [Kyrpidia spormannii]|uniref:Uncharacterized protein n=1 Tax=Kyrpidia spormannii TaxID=2055160 RepID=A0A6F9EGS4_9BACL|nr:conserved protein of unknown function [Kyrpidia spormannii]